MRRTWLVLAVVGWSLATAAVAAPVNEVAIAGFESASEVGRFRVRATKPTSDIVLSTSHATQGSHSARIRFPKWAPGSDEAPAAVMTAERGLPVNWSSADTIALDVFNASPTEVALSLFFEDTAGKSCTERVTLAPLASRTLHVNLDRTFSKVNRAKLKELRLFSVRPPEPVTLFVDHIRLESGIPARVDDARKTLARLRREAPADPFPAKKLDQLAATQRDLATRTSKAKGNLAALLVLRPEMTALEHGLQIEVPRAIAEARMRDESRKLAPAVPYAYGFASSMEKIFPRDIPFRARVASSEEVSVAGNETESIQLLLLATEQALKGVRVEVGPLSRADGKPAATLPTAQAAPVGFVKTQKPPYPVRYIGWYPDPILDFLTSFDIAKGDLQPVWIRVHAPMGTPAGEYLGEIRVHPANAAPVRLAIKVHVWGFDLPVQSRLRTAVSIYTTSFGRVYGAADTDEMRARIGDFVLKYRINPDLLYRRTPPNIRDLERWDKTGLNAFNIVSVPAPKNLRQGDLYPPGAKRAILATLDAVVPELKAKGLYSKAYVYGFDEVGPSSYAAMKDIFSSIKAKYPDLLLMTTARDYGFGETTGLGCADAWVPLTPNYDPARAKQARERGKQIWWYICIDPKAPYANFLIEYDAIEARMLMGLQTAKYQPDGFLYYAITRWPLSRKPITSGPYTDWPTASYKTCNGDGSLLCAGPTGPLATIRLENVRDGIEDYDYFELLQDEVTKLAGRTDPAAQKALRQAKEALTIKADLVQNMTIYTKSPEAIRAKRKQVAEAIEAARGVAGR